MLLLWVLRWAVSLLLLTLLAAPFSATTTTRAFSIGGVTKETSTKSPKILVLGGETGFVGSAIVSKLETLQVPYKTASRTASSSSSSSAVDLTAPDAAAQIQALAKGCTAVISTVGSIGNTNKNDDERINAANGIAATAARKAGCHRFVVIGNDVRVRQFAQRIPALRGYAAGKAEAEDVIRREFPDSYTILQPTFIYGGDAFQLNPPRIPATVGQVAEDILGLYPLQAASNALPGILGVATAAPVSVDRVASAAVNAALGLVVDQQELATREDIVKAAAIRPVLTTTLQQQRRRRRSSLTTLKQALSDLGNCQGDPACLDDAFTILEQIEDYNQRKPASDPLLNGRWNFCFDVEADAGTGVLREILEGNSPVKAIFNIDDLYMEIADNRDVTIYVQVQLAGGLFPILDVRLTTRLHPVPNDTTGTRFEEQFAGLSLMGMKVPIPESWQQSRPLEFSYLDDHMLIARGNGGEAHYLQR